MDVRGNKQLRFYGLGALATQQHLEIDSVCLVIIQPRVEWREPVQEEWLPVEDLLAFGPEIGEAIARCKAPDAPLVPGEAQCHFCAAAVTCPAREAHALAAVDETFSSVEQLRPDAMPVAVGVVGRAARVRHVASRRDSGVGRRRREGGAPAADGRRGRAGAEARGGAGAPAMGGKK